VAAEEYGARPGEGGLRSGGHPRVGWDCLADIGLLRAKPDVFGPVASDPTVSRTIDALADDADRVLAAIDAARAAAVPGGRRCGRAGRVVVHRTPAPVRLAADHRRPARGRLGGVEEAPFG
jgi:hypothetical protein